MKYRWKVKTFVQLQLESDLEEYNGDCVSITSEQNGIDKH